MIATETSDITGPGPGDAFSKAASSQARGNHDHAPRSMPWRLLLAMTVAGSCLPAIQFFRTPDPWMARVLLSERQIDAPYPSPGFDLAVTGLSSPASLGRAVDLLGLDKDAEFNGGKATALTVALELLNGEGAKGTDARNNAIAHLADLVRVERLSRPGNAALLIKASEQAKAEKIGEALAAVFTAPTDITGPVPVSAGKALQAGLQKAEAELAAFQSAAGNEALADVLVTRSRLAGLADHIARLSAKADPAEDPLAKATIADVLSGRVSGGMPDAGVSSLLEAWQRAKLSYDTLAGSLGPKHPQLLAAKADVDEARAALTQGLARYKTATNRAAADRQNQLAALKQTKSELEATLASSGIDLQQYDRLSQAVEQQRQGVVEDRPSSRPRQEPILEASAVEPLAAPSTLALPLRMLLGGISGLGAALAFALAARTHRQPAVTRPVEAAPAVSTETTQPVRERVRVEPPIMQGPDPILLPARKPQPNPAPVALKRQHVPANATDSGWVPGDALSVSDDDLVPLMPVRDGGVDRQDAGLSTVVKLRRVAPHVFDEPAEDADVQRLRQELADLRSRVLSRVHGSA